MIVTTSAPAAPVYLGGQTLGSASSTTPIVSWTGAYDLLTVEIYISGYSGSAVARLQASTTAGATPSATATTFLTQTQNTTITSPTTIAHAAASTGATGINGWNTGATVISGRRCQFWQIKNTAGQVKVVRGHGMHSYTDTALGPHDMTSGIFTTTAGQIQSLMLWSANAVTGNNSGGSMTAGSYLRVWGTLAA